MVISLAIWVVTWCTTKKRSLGGLAISGSKQEPGVAPFWSFILVLRIRNDGIHGNVVFFLGGISHQISSVFWGRLEKNCLHGYK